MQSNTAPPGLPANAADLVPHRGAMLLLDELTECSSDSVTGKAVIKPGNPFVDSYARLEPVAFVEILAQLAAAGQGYESKSGGGSAKKGFLVGVNNFVIQKQAALDETLTLTVKKTMEINNITVAEGSVKSGGETIASGGLKLYVENNALPPMERGVTASSPGQRPESGLLIAPEKRSEIMKGIQHSMQEITVSRENVTAEFCFPADFPGFQGHFPQYPILPGVAMIDLCLVLAELACSSPLEIRTIERAKFSRQITPGETVRGEARIEKRDHLYKVRTSLRCGDTPAAQCIFYAFAE